MLSGKIFLKKKLVLSIGNLFNTLKAMKMLLHQTSFCRATKSLHLFFLKLRLEIDPCLLVSKISGWLAETGCWLKSRASSFKLVYFVDAQEELSTFPTFLA